MTIDSAQRDCWKRSFKEHLKVDELRDDLATALDALKPFAAYSEKIGPQFADQCALSTNTTCEATPGDATVGDLRRAAAVLEKRHD